MVVAVSACGGAAPASSVAPAASTVAAPTAAGNYDEARVMQQMYDAAIAAGETEVNFYGSINEEEAKPLLDLWAKAFPKIKNNYTRGDEQALVSRILTEEGSGKHNFDTLSTTNSQLLVPASLALKWSAPNAALVDPDYKDKDGLWTGVYANWNVIQINTDKVKKGEIKSYEDVANPKWKGQVVIDDSDFEWYEGLVKVRGQAETDALLKKIAATTGIKVVNGHGGITDKVSAGEYAIALNQYMNLVERAKRLGGPTDWIAIEPVVVGMGKVVVSKSAPHPNAAKLLENWLLGKDAQNYVASRGRVLTRTDLKNQPPNLVDGLKKRPADLLYGDELTAVGKQFKAVFK